MGSIITALELGKPILVMPRRGDMRETRNDHQVATAERLDSLGRVRAAFDENQLTDLLDRIDELTAADSIRSHASDELLDAVRSFIHGGGA